VTAIGEGGPWLVTVTTPNRRLSRSDVKRTACETLSGARRAAWRETVARTRDMADALAASDFRSAASATMPETGGKIGPLPDGTVIEVERADRSRLASEVMRRASWRPPADMPLDALVATFNTVEDEECSR
jgi:hypothetical protein